jgi:phage-related protein
MNTQSSFEVYFYQTDSKNESVRDWLKNLSKEQRKVIGEDIKLLQYRWPLGMPLVRKLESDLWEVRSKLPGNTKSRIFFTVNNNQLILLHGFIKKSKRTPKHEIELARSRKDKWFKEETKL